MALPFFTVGHSVRTLEELAELLAAGDIAVLADIRTIRRSRTNPQFNQDVLGGDLAPFGIEYRPLPALGGRRGRSHDVPAGVNALWRNQSFHNYADYAMSGTFREGLDELIAWGREQRTAFMCSEAVWWRCHRRIVADHLLVRGESVVHLMGADRIEPARLTDGAVVTDGTVTYPPPPG